MATNIQKPLQAYGRTKYIASGCFTTAGTGAPTVNQQRGFSSITRTGVGVFVLALMFVPKEADFQVTPEYTTDAQGIMVARNLASKTVTITVVGAGGSTPADTTGMRINVLAIMPGS